MQSGVPRPHPRSSSPRNLAHSRQGHVRSGPNQGNEVEGREEKGRSIAGARPSLPWVGAATQRHPQTQPKRTQRARKPPVSTQLPNSIVEAPEAAALGQMALGENRKPGVAECREGAGARKCWLHRATWEHHREEKKSGELETRPSTQLGHEVRGNRNNKYMGLTLRHVLFSLIY